MPKLHTICKDIRYAQTQRSPSGRDGYGGSSSGFRDGFGGSSPGFGMGLEAVRQEFGMGVKAGMRGGFGGSPSGSLIELTRRCTRARTREGGTHL